MPLAPSVPRDSAEGREFLQCRMALFARVLFFLDFGFFLLGRVVELVSGELSFGVFLEAGQLAHLASCASLAVIWLLCRGRPRSAVALDRIDAGGFILVAVFYALMGATIPADEPELPRAMSGAFAAMIMIVAFTNTLIGRAVLVPSSPARTFWISVGSTVPILAAIVVLTVYRTGLRPMEQVLGVVQFAAWVSLPVVISTVTSRVIYGLREQVREATQLGQYTLVEKIGEGGMGAVYRARHAMLRRPTAIKLLPPEKAGEQSIARFEREVQLTSTLTHPNTIAIYDFGRTPDGIFYYAMELLDGADLEKLVDADGAQPPGRVAHVLAQVCGALAEAHDIGLIHRDIKPGNIILCRRGGAHDVAKVVDFGLVKDRVGVAGDGALSLSSVGTLTGTPMYLSPEAIRDPGAVDARSDLYAVGAVGYFLLTGKPVFSATNVIELCALHLNAAPEPPEQRLGRPLPERLVALIMRCLAKRPAERPSSAAEVRDGLLACGAGPWSEADAAAWWNRRGDAIKVRSEGAPVDPQAGTVAIDLRRRRPSALPAVEV